MMNASDASIAAGEMDGFAANARIVLSAIIIRMCSIGRYYGKVG
jgi:hypothetical protein